MKCSYVTVNGVNKVDTVTKPEKLSPTSITKDHTFYLIDYVNDQCDMRLKSNHPDGVPDVLVKQFIQRMLAKVALL